MTTIEQLTKETDEIKSSLEKLKNDVSISESEKKKKAKELKEKAETTRQKIQTEIDALSSKTDDVSVEIEEAKALLKSFNESLKLYEDILNSPDVKSSDKKKSTSTAEEKGFFGEIGEWISKQRKDIWSKEKWKKEKQENALRTAGFAATGIGLGVLIKKLFSKEDREARKQRRKERREARRKARAALPFWQRPIGKVIKWSGIGTIVYIVAHGIYTGNWFEGLTKRGTLKTETAKEQVRAYEQLSEQEREKYEKIGENVNDYYGNIRANENEHGYESPYDLGTISKKVAEDAGIDNAKVYKGLVPFCMSDGVSNIGELLSEKNITTYLFDKHTTQIGEELKIVAVGALGNALLSFLSQLKSFIPFNKGSNSLGEKIEKWINESGDKKEDRINELNFFFRQYSKVLTYLNDKKTSIEYMIAKDYLNREYPGFNTKSEYDQNNIIQHKLSDDEWVNKYVKSNDKYNQFMNSKIIDSGAVLNNMNLFDGEMSTVVKIGIVDPIDNEFDDIMQVQEGTTIIDKYKDELNDNRLSNEDRETTKGEVLKMCKDLREDIEGSEDNEGGLFKGVEYFLNTQGSNRKTFLEETGLNNFVDALISKISGIETKISNNEVTEKELEQLKETAVGYFAFQKEVAIATHTFQDIKSDNPNFLRRFLRAQVIGFNNYVDRLKKIYHGDGTFGDYLVVTVGTGQIILLLSSEARKTVGSAIAKGFVRSVGAPKNAIVWVAGRPAFSNAGFQNALNGLNTYKGVAQSYKESYFLDFALNGKIKNDGFMVNVAQTDLNINKGTIGEVLQELLKKQGNTLNIDQCNLIRRYAGNSDINKLIITQTRAPGATADVISEGFKHINDTFKIDTKNLAKLKSLDDAIGKLDPKTYSYKVVQDMLNKSIKQAGDLDTLTDIAKKIHNDPEFASMIDNCGGIRVRKGTLNHINDVKDSTAFKQIKTEIGHRRINQKKVIKTDPTKAINLDNDIRELSKFRDSFVSMSAKEFDQVNELMGILGKTAGGGVGTNVKILNKIIEEGIELNDGTKKVFTDSDIGDILKRGNSSDAFQELKKALSNVSDDWKVKSGLTDIRKFTDCLCEFSSGSKFLSDVDDYLKAIKKALKVIGKLS